MKIISKIGCLFVVLTSFLFVTGCEQGLSGSSDPDTTVDDIAAVKQSLEIGFATGDTQSSVTKDITLLEEKNGVTITWASDKPEVISNEGLVTRPKFRENDMAVTLTATLKKNEVKDTKAFNLIVKKQEASIKYQVRFNSNGGTKVENQEILEGNCIEKPENPTKDDEKPSKEDDEVFSYVFDGWYLGTELYDFTKPVFEDIKLNAAWKKLSTKNETVRIILDYEDGSIHNDTFENGTKIKTVFDKDGKVTDIEATDKNGKEIVLEEVKLPSNHIEGNNYEARIPLLDLLPGEEFIKGDKIHFDITAVGNCDMNFIYMYIVVNTPEDGWTGLGSEAFGLLGDTIHPGDTDSISLDYEIIYQMINRDPKNVQLIIGSNYPEGESREIGNHRDYVSLLANITVTIDKTNRPAPVTINFSTPMGTCPASATMYPGQIIYEEVEGIPAQLLLNGWFDDKGNQYRYAPETDVNLTAKISKSQEFTVKEESYAFSREILEANQDACLLFVDKKLDATSSMWSGMRLGYDTYGQDPNGDDYYVLTENGESKKVYFKDVIRMEGNRSAVCGTYYFTYSVKEVLDWANSYNIDYSKVTFFDWGGNNEVSVVLTYDFADFTAKAWKIGENDIFAEKVPCGYPIPENTNLYGLNLYTDEACTNKVETLSSEYTTLYQQVPDPIYSDSKKLKISYSKEVDGVIVTLFRPAEDIGKDYANLYVSDTKTRVTYDNFTKFRDKNSTATEETFIFPFVKNGQLMEFELVYQPNEAEWFSETVKTTSGVTGLDVDKYFDFSDGKLIDTVMIGAEDSYKMSISNDISKYIHFNEFDFLKMSGLIVSGNTYWAPGTWIGGYNIFFDENYVTNGRDLNYRDLLSGYDLGPFLAPEDIAKLASYPTWFLSGDLEFRLKELPETQFKLKIKYTPDYLHEYKSYKYSAE